MSCSGSDGEIGGGVVVPFIYYIYNSLGLLNFEAYRDRAEGDDASLWSESFHSHHDSKPLGPSSGVWYLY